MNNNTFTVDTLNTLSQSVSALIDGNQQQLPAADYLRQTLADHLPAEFPTLAEAENFLADVEKGIKQFRSTMESVENTDDPIDALLEQTLANLSDEQQPAALTNILVTLQAATATEPLSEQALADLTEQVATNYPTDDDKRQAIRTALSADTLLDYQALANAATATTLTADQLNQLRDTLTEPLYYAVAALLEARKGNLTLADDINPEMLGMSIAAALKAAEATAELNQGTLELPRWAQIIRTITAVVLTGATLLALTGAFMAASMALCGFMLLTFGNSVLVYLAVFGMLFYPTMKFSELLETTLDNAYDWFKNAYDRAYQWAGTAIEWLRKKWETVQQQPVFNTQAEAVTSEELTTEPLAETPLQTA